MAVVHAIMLAALEDAKPTLPGYAKHNNMNGSKRQRMIVPTSLPSLYREMEVKYARARPLPPFGLTPTWFRRVAEQGLTGAEKDALVSELEVVGPRPGVPTPLELRSQRKHVDVGLGGEVGRGPEEEVGDEEGEEELQGKGTVADEEESEGRLRLASASSSDYRSQQQHLSGPVVLALRAFVDGWDARQPQSGKRRASIPWYDLKTVCELHDINEDRARLWIKHYRAGTFGKALSTTGGSLSGASTVRPLQAAGRKRSLDAQMATRKRRWL